MSDETFLRCMKAVCVALIAALGISLLLLLISYIGGYGPWDPLRMKAEDDLKCRKIESILRGRDTEAR